MHGNNRLASNSLLEALVFSRRAAADIAKRLQDAPTEFAQVPFDIDPEAPPVPQGIRTQLRHILQESYFVIPNKEKMHDNFSKVCAILRDLEDGNYLINADYVEAKATATMAFLILNEAMIEQKGA